MLAGAVRIYLNRFAVRVGQEALVVTNNDSAYATAFELAAAGASVTILDTRQQVPAVLTDSAATAGITVLPGYAVIRALGWRGVRGADIAPIDKEGTVQGKARRIPCDLIACSAGWLPNLHLWSQLYGAPEYHAALQCFEPGHRPGARLNPAGSVMGHNSIATVIAEGFAAGITATGDSEKAKTAGPPPKPFDGGLFRDGSIGPIWCASSLKGKAFIDLQHDVKLSDIDQAHREGYVSVEHLKRYTTTGMATDQGKLSNLNALSRMATLQGREIEEVGTTTFRPPYTPVTIGALVGPDHGADLRPTRRSPLHDWHVNNGAGLTEAGLWQRAWYYPLDGEDVGAAYRREADHVRHHVGLVDVSTLGKIAVQGPDAADFLNRVYVNGWKTLKPGRIRYGVMLREDGIVLDDGATACLAEHDYFMTTTTANAAKILADFERRLQTDWRDMKVQVTSLTDQFAAMALAGPNARLVLQTLSPQLDCSPQALPNNSFAHAHIAGHPVRIHRMSFSGELAYEIYTPSGFGQAVWQAVIDAGKTYHIMPYGTESMGTLRIEKGHVAGPELDGRTTLEDLRLSGLASTKKPFVGSVLRHRPDLQARDRPTLVGLLIDGDTGARGGSLIFADGAECAGHGDGWITSTTYSPALCRHIAMGFVKDGPNRLGQRVQVVNPLENQRLTATLTSHHFFDPEGERQNG
jgi:sarcosine oxidase subunit alpha